MDRSTEESICSLQAQVHVQGLALRSLAACTAPTTGLNVSGPATSIRALAVAFGERLGVRPQLTGAEADTAWLVDTTEAQRLFGLPEVILERMIDWTADWVARGGASLGKATHYEVRDGNY